MFELNIGLFKNKLLFGGLNLVGLVLLRRRLLRFRTKLIIYIDLIELVVKLVARYCFGVPVRVPITIDVVVQVLVHLIQVHERSNLG